MKGAFHTFALVAALWSQASAGGIPIAWNERYRTDVPYEVELSPERLGIGSEKIVVMADGQALETTMLPGSNSDSVRLRFIVPAGTKTLGCRTEAGGCRRILRECPDDIFAGVLTPGRWTVNGKGSVSATANGLRFRVGAAANQIVTAEAVVPEGMMAGEESLPVRVEIDLMNVSSLAWGNAVTIEQIDAEGNALPELMTDPRWISHMLPVGKNVSYRENGRIHPKARKLRICLELHSRNPEFDSYGLPRQSNSDALAQLDMTRFAVRPAAELPFPGYDRDFFPPGVGGSTADRALALGPRRAFWYQTRGMGAWAGDGKTQYRDECDIFFPAKDGTVEAWFRPDWTIDDSSRTFHLFSGGSHSIPLSYDDVEHKGRGQLFAVTYAPKARRLGFSRKDMNGRVFKGEATVEIPSAVWTHVACTFVPGDVARVFVNGKVVLEVSLAGYVPMDLRTDPMPNNRDLTVAMVGAPMMDACLSVAPKASAPFYSGAVDLWRVSSSVRYSESFVPSKSFVADSDTRALFTFDESKDGTSGGGLRFIPGTLLAEKGLVSLNAEKDGQILAYNPVNIIPENNPSVVLNRENYRRLPTPADHRAARKCVSRVYRVSGDGTFATFDLAGSAYPDFVEIANEGERPLEYPIVLNSGDLDPRSFGDLADSLGVLGLSDKEKVDKIFNFLLGASDYFCADTATYEPDSPSPENAQVKALMSLNAYCGFECGPLNMMACNLFACSAGCPANLTSGYGHMFQEVFFNGKNHLYDLSAQSFFPSWDNVSSASLGETEDEPGVCNRIGMRAGHFIRQATRRCKVQDPSYRRKSGVVLNPGERFRAWFDNAGIVNDLFCTSRLDAYLKAKTRRYCNVLDVADECLAVENQAKLHRIERYFPQAANGYLEFDGVPAVGNPAFADDGSSFRYRVVSPYPITAASYVARRVDGSVVPIAFSFDGCKSWRNVSGTEFDYPVRARLAYWVRIKAPMAEVASFTARTTVQFNARVFPGRVKSGKNVFRFGSHSGGKAQVTLAWRENTDDEIVFPGSFATGYIPGVEKATLFADPTTGPVSIMASGSKEETITLTAKSDKPHFEYVTATGPNGGEKTLTVVVCPDARQVPAADAKLVGGAKFMPADKTSAQDRVMLSSPGERAVFTFTPLKPGRYVVLSVCRFQGHSPTLRNLGLNAILDAEPSTTVAARAINPLVNYFKVEYGDKNGRGPWKWDVALDPKTSYPYQGVCAFDCPNGLREVVFEPGTNLVSGAELAGVVVLPWPEDSKFRQDVLKILCGVNCSPERVK